MNKFVKIITAAIAVIIIMSCSTLTAFASNSAKGFDGDTSNCGIYDDKDVFRNTPDILEELNELVRETSEELEIYIAIYLSNEARSESQTNSFADLTYEKYFDPDTDGVFYYMDLSEQYSAYDYISTSGICNIYYGDKTDDMFSVIFKHLPASGDPIEPEQIEDGIRTILSEFRSYSKEPDSTDYFYDPYKKTYTYYRKGEVIISNSKPASLIFEDYMKVGPLVSCIVALIFFLVSKSRYKFKKGCDSFTYLSDGKTRFIQREDKFIREYTTKHRIETNSGGGSSRSGGGGGCGSGSHGGGGGHR